MYYYVGSELSIEWTSQHSCGASNADCQIVLQYMCDVDSPGIRDGTPNDANDAATDTVDENTAENTRYGLHEPLAYYKKCQTRERNGGLYVADRQTENPGRLLRNSPATQTRQNPNGARSGFECPEERDYYPYWHPTPWRDIAVFTSNKDMCKFYQSESRNVKPVGECVATTDNTKILKYNNPFDCHASGEGEWVEREAWDIAAPECLSTDLIASRDNHLGNANTNKANSGGGHATYKWKIPNLPSSSCVFRIRYNITATDISFTTDAFKNGDRSPLKQDPFQDWGHGSFLSLAVNTNQVGRTFQDRSYVFEIRKRPKGVSGGTKIYNIGVRGKRGNIVQVYPAVEYDFTPNNLDVSADDYVHFQWTGSDYNPARNPNDAEGGPKDPQDGQLRSDRSNVVQLDYPGLSVPRPAQFSTMFVKRNGKVDKDLVTKFAFVDQDLTKCLDWASLLQKNNNNKDEAEKDPQNCAKLNAATTPYFDGGLVRLYAGGTFHYYSTRNNNFSNRGQRATIKVRNGYVAAGSTVSYSTFQIVVAIVIAVSLCL
jgi:hypothetical protein